MTDHPNLPPGSPPGFPRVYGDKEIGQILKRATELQNEEPTASSSSGLTLRELEEVAVEAGIDPRFLQRAAMELGTNPTDADFWTKVVGDELVLLRETTVPGELSDDGFERVASVIQIGTREQGQPSLLGRSLTWHAETANKTRSVQVTVTSRDGQTHVRLEENLNQLAGGLFGGVVGGFGIGFGVGMGLPLGLGFFGSALVATAFPVGLVGLSYIGARQIYRAVTKSRRRVMGELFDKILAEVIACAEDRAVESAKTPGQLPSGSTEDG
ncbi:MAG: hypothetical protein IIB37_07755 [Gemmatimonadetes bacterium]|nr:hypothetical protein [Gemmatimonadota bacterium]MCH8812674.1 hypothetical protein [Gemmatimonadota bacterium]